MELVCIWCGETRAQHRDSGPVAKVPCGGLKRGFNSGLPDEHSAHAQQHSEVLAEIDKAADEAIRVDRWHATYNAALTGLCANRSEPKDPRHHEIHLDARIMADLAHGELPK